MKKIRIIVAEDEEIASTVTRVIVNSNRDDPESYRSAMRSAWT